MRGADLKRFSQSILTNPSSHHKQLLLTCGLASYKALSPRILGSGAVFAATLTIPGSALSTTREFPSGVEDALVTSYAHTEGMEGNSGV